MNKKYWFIFLSISVLLASGYLLFSKHAGTKEDFVCYRLDFQKQDLQLYWRDNGGQLFKSIGSLKGWLDAKGERLLFAMNAGMFKPNYAPQGLFIQEGKVITPLDTTTGTGNFYIKPNGVFYSTDDHRGVICRTDAFVDSGSIRYATQSGPMLLIDGQIHPAFTPGSTNKAIRNGVGILPDGTIVFAMSKKPINFYDFASFFKQLGCRNALYLDGFVSRTYLPEKHWIQTEGNMGVIVGVTAK